MWFSTIGPHGLSFATPLLICVISQIVFWIKKPRLRNEEKHINYGKAIFVGLIAGLSALGFFVLTKYFLRPDTLDFFVFGTVVAEFFINIPLPVLFVRSLPNLKDYVSSWFRKNIPTTIINFILYCNRVLVYLRPPKKVHPLIE